MIETKWNGRELQFEIQHLLLWLLLLLQLLYSSSPVNFTLLSNWTERETKQQPIERKKQLVAPFYSFAIFFQLYRALQKYFSAKIFKSAASARQKKKSIEIRIAVVVVVVVTVVEIVWTFETVWRSRKKSICLQLLTSFWKNSVKTKKNYAGLGSLFLKHWNAKISFKLQDDRLIW